MQRWATVALALALALLCTTTRAEQHVFELAAPDAREVFLAGEMTNWDQGKLPLAKDTDGVWRAHVELAPGQWIYKFVVDGRWIADPGHVDHDADGQGGQHSS